MKTTETTEAMETAKTNEYLTQPLIQVQCNLAYGNGFKGLPTFYINHNGNNRELWIEQVISMFPSVIVESISLMDLTTGKVEERESESTQEK